MRDRCLSRGSTIVGRRRRLPLFVLILSMMLMTPAFTGTAFATHSPTDYDGDGWANTVDLCPQLYNDRGWTYQRDYDQDGVGDACDQSWYSDPDGGSAWALRYYFFDAAEDSLPGPFCSTVTLTETVHYGPPYDFDATDTTGPFHSCLTNGGAMDSTHFRGSDVASLSRSYTITCDTGGTITGSLPDDTATYLPLTEQCTASGSHLWNGGVPNNPPMAIMSGIPVDWRSPYSMAFSAAGSYDPEAGPLTYRWEFGDGATSTQANPTHAYLAPGTFDVLLTVTDNTGQTATTADRVGITGDPLKDFAPEVRLHPNETHFPMDPSTFIANSVLGWSHDANCTDDYQVSRPSASKLGGGGFKHQEADDTSRCRHFGTSWPSNRYTRPFDQGKAGRVSIANEEGFFLNFDPGAEPAAFGQAPVWTETTTGAPNTFGNVNTYWFFYGRSVPRWNGIALPTAHEGDWEHANVELNQNKAPTKVWYYAHAGGPDKQSYVQVQRTGLLHPVVYVAWDAHGSYPTVGTTEVCDYGFCLDDIRDDGGPVWRTWLDVRSVRLQPWYGYGGAWGEKGETGDTTGPLGPSLDKNPASQ